jgi:hypothetical protein
MNILNCSRESHSRRPIPAAKMFRGYKAIAVASAVLSGWLAASPVHAKLNIVATTPDLGAIAQ